MGEPMRLTRRAAQKKSLSRLPERNNVFHCFRWFYAPELLGGVLCPGPVIRIPHTLLALVAAKDHEPVNVAMLRQPVTAEAVAGPLLNPATPRLAILRYAGDTCPVLA